MGPHAHVYAPVACPRNCPADCGVARARACAWPLDERAGVCVSTRVVVFLPTRIRNKSALFYLFDDASFDDAASRFLGARRTARRIPFHRTSAARRAYRQVAARRKRFLRAEILLEERERERTSAATRVRAGYALARTGESESGR